MPNFSATVRGGFAALAMLAAIGGTSVSAATTVVVQNGPDAGELRVETPWGDYVAYDEGGGEIWVGTQREYDRARVVGIMREDHARLSTVNVSGADATTFVTEGTLRTSVAGIAIDGIDPSIRWDEPVRRRGVTIPGTRYVDFVWIENSPSTPAMVLVSQSGHRSYTTSDEARSNEWGGATFAVSRHDLTAPMLLVFLFRGQRPAILRIPSIAWLDYRATCNELHGEMEGISDPQDQYELRHLNLLDPHLRCEH